MTLQNLRGQVHVDVMLSITAVAVSAYLGFPGLGICPPVQEDLDGPEVVFLSSIEEGRTSILSETQRDHTLHVYMEHKYFSQNKYTVTSILSYIHVHILYAIFVCVYV